MAKKPDLKNLSHDQIQILLQLQEHPLATYDELAEFTNLPKTTVYRIVKNFEDPIYKPPYFQVTAFPDLKNLGLEYLEVFIEAGTPNEIAYCKKLCNIHPYIWYYAKCFGKINGYFLQFRLPKNNREKILDLFNISQIKNWIKNYEIIHFKTDSFYTRPLIKHWNLQTLSWDFNWEEWFDAPLKMKKITEPPKSKFEEIKTWLQQKDIAILAELVRNMRRKNKTMIKFMKDRGWPISSPTFSRRFKLIDEHLIKFIRTDIHPASFDLLNPVLLWGYANPEFLENIQIRLREYPIPFKSTFKVDNYKLYWYLHIPTLHLSDLLEHLHPKIHNLEFYFIDYPKSQAFLPDASMYDEVKKAWRSDYDFLVNDPLKEIEEEFVKKI